MLCCSRLPVLHRVLLFTLILSLGTQTYDEESDIHKEITVTFALPDGQEVEHKVRTLLISVTFMDHFLICFVDWACSWCGSVKSEKQCST